MLRELENIVNKYLISYRIKILENGNDTKMEVYGGIAHGIYTITKMNRLIYRCVFKNGKMNGIAEKWYDTGILQFRCNYKNSSPDGLYQKWHETGLLHKQCQYTNGKIHGKYELWTQYENFRYSLKPECFYFDHGVLI